MNVISIVPRLPPAVDGVGDYAVQIAKLAHEKSIDIKTILLEASPLSKQQPLVDGFSTYKLQVFSEEGFVSCIGSLTNNSDKDTLLVLHYANYGYGRIGCPYWLLKGLKRWKFLYPNSKLVIMFHEICNTVKVKPWKHSFWTPPIQKNIALQLAQLANKCITSNSKYASLLEGLSGRNDIEILPVFSTIAEPISTPCFNDRKNKLIIFGQQRRRESYRLSWPHIRKVCELFNIQEILDIGPQLDIAIPSYVDIPVRQMGQLSKEKLSTILLESKIGFLNYLDEPVTKSSVFASYCSHGMLPICHMASATDKEGLISNSNYINASLTEITVDTLRQASNISSAAHGWYQTHRLEAQIDTLMHLTKGSL
jgi:hypothetical protein